MSLDLYITSNTPVCHRGTGVYIREDGGTRELTTKQEVLAYFPDTNPDLINEVSYEDHTYFHTNLTHNLTEMAEECVIKGRCTPVDKEEKQVTLYDLLWHPKEHLGVIQPSMDYLLDVMECYSILLERPAFFKKYNPKNGWGTYEQLVKSTKKYIAALHSISQKFDNYMIEADI